MPDLTASQIEAAHPVHAETLELGRYRRVVREQTEQLTLALHAMRNGSPEVADEFVDRAILALSHLRSR